MLRATGFLCCVLVLVGCAAPRAERATPAFRDAAMTVERAGQAIEIGKSSKAEVRTLLGEPEAVAFESGYEVWVYRTRRTETPRASPELVLLFAPTGLVKKVRVRPAYAAAAR